ncbi:hypothetical protein BB561_003491 [Smittium simulii]|uniref:Uncharacterized protein n=1 Tax=Smittium simulii TaxID=133385 RepID=A0A2T9YL40_9FUNG|nr:hypothetical protein BB561_003491 [Smittium simulii]
MEPPTNANESKFKQFKIPETRLVVISDSVVQITLEYRSDVDEDRHHLYDNDVEMQCEIQLAVISLINSKFSKGVARGKGFVIHQTRKRWKLFTKYIFSYNNIPLLGSKYKYKFMLELLDDSNDPTWSSSGIIEIAQIEGDILSYENDFLSDIDSIKSNTFNNGYYTNNNFENSLLTHSDYKSGSFNKVAYNKHIESPVYTHTQEDYQNNAIFAQNTKQSTCNFDFKNTLINYSGESNVDQEHFTHNLPSPKTNYFFSDAESKITQNHDQESITQNYDQESINQNHDQEIKNTQNHDQKSKITQNHDQKSKITQNYDQEIKLNLPTSPKYNSFVLITEKPYDKDYYIDKSFTENEPINIKDNLDSSPKLLNKKSSICLYKNFESLGTYKTIAEKNKDICSVENTSPDTRIQNQDNIDLDGHNLRLSNHKNIHNKAAKYISEDLCKTVDSKALKVSQSPSVDYNQPHCNFDNLTSVIQHESSIISETPSKKLINSLTNNKDNSAVDKIAEQTPNNQNLIDFSELNKSSKVSLLSNTKRAASNISTLYDEISESAKKIKLNLNQSSQLKDSLKIQEADNKDNSYNLKALKKNYEIKSDILNRTPYKQKKLQKLLTNYNNLQESTQTDKVGNNTKNKENTNKLFFSAQSKKSTLSDLPLFKQDIFEIEEYDDNKPKSFSLVNDKDLTPKAESHSESKNKEPFYKSSVWKTTAKNDKSQISKCISETEAARRYAKSGFIEKRFIEECPFCRNIAPETIEHMLLELATKPPILPASISMRLVGKLLGEELKLSSTRIRKDSTVLCVKTTLATAKFLNAIALPRYLMLNNADTP